MDTCQFGEILEKKADREVKGVQLRNNLLPILSNHPNTLRRGNEYHQQRNLIPLIVLDFGQEEEFKGNLKLLVSQNI